METSKFIEKIKTRGYWVLILEPKGKINNKFKKSHPRDKYNTLKATNVQYRGWPTPYFPSNFPEDGNFLEISENITGGVDWEHYKEIFTLFNSGQFLLLSGVPEDWVDESERLRGSELGKYKPGEILSFVSAIYYITEIFAFIQNLINSDLYRETPTFMLKLSLENTNERKLKAFGDRIDFFHEYKSSSRKIKIFDDQIKKEDLSENMEIITRDCIITLFKYFGTYEPNYNLIETEIRNLLERKV